MPHIYVRRGGMDVQPAPWVCDGKLHAYMFYLRAGRAELEKLCQRCLNAPSGDKLKYEPVAIGPFGHYVALTFQHFEKLRSTSGAATQFGMHTYNEASFWVPVRNRGADASLEMFIPYMFVDNWVALTSGREAYGFPKEYADKLNMPGSGAGLFSVDALALTRNDGPCEAVTQRIVSCAPIVDFENLEGFIEVGFGEDIWPMLNVPLIRDSLRPYLGPIWEIIEMLLRGELPLVFLRQIRAAAGEGGADLQQIVTASANPFRVLSLRPVQPHVLTLANLPSHPIARDLGLDPASQMTICLELDIQFGLAPGKVLWP